MFTKNRLIILFTLLYLFIEIGFRALVNEHLRFPSLAKDVTDMFVVLGRLISAIGFTVILFNILKNNELVNEHPKKTIAGLYLSSFVVISLITSLALTWLPVETQKRAFYAHYFKAATYFRDIEGKQGPVKISEAKLTTLPLMMITESPFLSVQNYAEPLIPETIDKLVYTNQQFYLNSLAKIEKQFSPLWVQYQNAFDQYKHKTRGEQLADGAFWVQMLYRKFARELFLDYRTDVLKSFDLNVKTYSRSFDEKSSTLFQDENWRTETYDQSGNVLRSRKVNKNMLSRKERRDETEGLHQLENSFKKERHGFNTIETSAEYFELLRRHEHYFRARLTFPDKSETVNLEFANQLSDYANSRCKSFKLESATPAQKHLLNGHLISAVYTVTSRKGEKVVSFIPVEYQGFKRNFTICDYRSIEKHIRKILVDTANNENISRGFNRDIDSLNDFKQTVYARKEITKKLEMRLGVPLEAITKANKAYFERAYKTTVSKEIKETLSKYVAKLKLSCQKQCGDVIPLGLDRVSLLSLPVFREKLQSEYPGMYDENDRFVSATESKESRTRTLLRISKKHRKEAQRIIDLIHSGEVTKADLAPYTRATLGPILLMVFANAAILLNFASLLITTFKIKRRDMALVIAVIMLSLPLIAEKYGTNSRFAVTTTHEKTLTWLLGTNRVVSTIPLVEHAAKRASMHMLHLHLQFFRDNVGKNQLRARLYKQLK